MATTISDRDKKIIRAVLSGSKYRAVSAAYRVSTSEISRIVKDFINRAAPEVYANISADGKITVKELRDHALYLTSILDQEGLGIGG